MIRVCTQGMNTLITFFKTKMKEAAFSSEITNKIENATGKTIQLSVDTSEPAVEDRYVIVTTYEKDDSTVDDTSGISTNTRTRRGSKAPAPNEDEEDTLSIGSSVTYNQRVYANIIVFVCIIFTTFIC